MSTPTQNNRISFSLTPAERKTIDDAFAQIESILAPKLIALTPETSAELPRMGKVTTSFVGKSLEYGKAHPDLVPSFVALAELETDLGAATLLAEYGRRLSVLQSGLSDTATLSGSEAYSAALSIYGNVRLAAKNSVSGAQAIYDDLAERFPGRPPKKSAAPSA